MKRRTVLASAGITAISLMAGCLQGTDNPDGSGDEGGNGDEPSTGSTVTDENDDRTDEECHLIQIRYDRLPPDVQAEVDAVLESGQIVRDRLLFAEAIDTGLSYIVVDDTPYKPIVGTIDDKQTLDLRKVDVIRQPEPEIITVQNTGSREHEVHVIFSNDETYIDETITLGPDEEIDLESTDKFGSYDLRARTVAGDGAEDRFEFKVGDSYGYGIIVVSDIDILVTQEVADIAPCPWE